jgi:glyoxylase-like metal-dependent hydrolase (beta-lactamase superfamily II)
MYELFNIQGNTWYIQAHVNIGIIKISETEVVLIDSGNDKDVAKKILGILQSKGWILEMIVNTHSNADHIGGNAYLYEKTQCRIAATGFESAFIQYPMLEPSFLFGAYPPSPLRNKFLLAQPSFVTDILSLGQMKDMPFKIISLPGHFMDMIGILTQDEIFFVADTLFKKEILDKYKIPFIYDVKGFLETLSLLEQTRAQWFVPSHAEPTSDIGLLVRVNRAKVVELCELIREKLIVPMNFEALLKNIFDHFSLSLDFSQYVLAGSTIKSFLSYLHDGKQVDAFFKDNVLWWKRV